MSRPLTTPDFLNGKDAQNGNREGPAEDGGGSYAQATEAQGQAVN